MYFIYNKYIYLLLIMLFNSSRLIIYIYIIVNMKELILKLYSFFLIISNFL